ncbi:hypothetical protein BN77_p40071 [Rhizobium mesoamericanum STM3625]|uniref:Transposase n=1 Tax=Rhizobium mesoamericanum STM3625 TaxID=1211777 RepID=K0Q0F6_9HYPH|nr:hypothetical protein BN77_p40071 [Rhizobium mesoamericanum STM3625]
MKRTRFTDEQIIGILKEHEAGTPVSELCRKHGVSDASIYKWKAKLGGMDVAMEICNLDHITGNVGEKYLVDHKTSASAVAGRER